MLGRIVNRERPVVVLFAIHKVARERQSVRESDVKLDLFATQIGRGRQGRDLVKHPFELLRAFKKRGTRQRALSRSAPPFDSGFGITSARGPNGLRPATDRAGPYGKSGKSLRSASNSRFIRGNPG